MGYRKETCHKGRLPSKNEINSIQSWEEYSTRFAPNGKPNKSMENNGFIIHDFAMQQDIEKEEILFQNFILEGTINSTLLHYMCSQAYIAQIITV